jgi:hypothetical protein
MDNSKKKKKLFVNFNRRTSSRKFQLILVPETNYLLLFFLGNIDP